MTDVEQVLEPAQPIRELLALEDWSWEAVFDRVERFLQDRVPMEGLVFVVVSRPAVSGTPARIYRLFARQEGGYRPLYLFSRCPFLDGVADTCAARWWGDLSQFEPVSIASEFERYLRERGARSVLVVPVVHGAKVGDESFAVVLGFYHSQGGQYNEEALRRLEVWLPVLALVFQLVHLHQSYQLRRIHTGIIRDISTAAIAELFSSGRLYERAVELIQERFQFYDVAVLEVDWEARQLRLVAHAGRYPYYQNLDYVQSVEMGILGLVAREGQPYVANDVQNDPYYINPFPHDLQVRSELALPIFVGQQVAAVLEIQSETVGAFADADVDALEVLARLLGQIVRTGRSIQELRHFEEFNRQVLDTMPAAIAHLDSSQRIVYANSQFLALFRCDPSNLLFRPLSEVVPSYLFYEQGLQSLFEQLAQVRGCGMLTEVKIEPSDLSRRLDVRLCRTDTEPPEYILIVQDVTSRVLQINQMRKLHRLAMELQRTLDVDALCRLILTSVTAGPGFGLNRAVIFLYDEQEKLFVERHAVGPSSAQEAYDIWQRIPFQRLEEYFEEARRDTVQSDVSIYRRYTQIRATDGEVRALVARRQPFLVRDAEAESSSLVRALRALSTAEEVVIMPLIARNRLLGVIVADNLITRQAIDAQMLETLSAFASQAALALANALAYRELEAAYKELQEARDRLSQQEKLAIIGQMAAHVAHEIRNPLVAIGGYARRICQTSRDETAVRRAEVILREAERLELILKEVMDFASPFTSMRFQTVSLEQLVREVCDVILVAAQEANVQIVVEAAPDLPPVRADADRMKQVFHNLAKNAIEAMPEGGTLTFRLYPEGGQVVAEVEDTGVGIDPESQKRLFEPFFTTKRHGSGLGLAITKRIVEHHEGTIEVCSKPGGGTKFTIRLPRAQE
ncbi:MAG: hypothetical protein KatS3mg115_1853 [Candidatus Poribacteria bacterium]|nr:MAG: hypothetical protein KatS3mg115_1853 [Candidatus Poribacteria bacterium]